MSLNDPRVRLRHMIDYAEEALELIHGLTRSEFESDRKVPLALSQCMLVVGEAASQINEPIRYRFREIPWHKIIGMRNHIVHAYSVVDNDVIWETATTELAPLIEKLERIINVLD